MRFQCRLVASKAFIALTAVSVLVLCQTGVSEAGIVNGDFEADEFTYTPSGWTASGAFITGDCGDLITDAEVKNDTFFAMFNSDVPEQPLTNNTISQTAVADGSALEFSWSRMRRYYPDDGGVTLQAAYQDITAGTPLVTQDIDFAPEGSESSGIQEWRQVNIPGFTVGNTYFIELRAGLSSTVSADLSHRLIYTIDNVAFTPEPATLSFLALGGLSLLRRRRR